VSVAAKASVELADFGGIKDVDPRDLSPGDAEQQTNAASLIMGQLTIRQGYRPVVFDNSVPGYAVSINLVFE
jgi:hypothetical protein